MRRRLQEMAAGFFDGEGPKIKLSSDRLELSFEEGSSLSGVFGIESCNQVPMRGIVYSNNPHMEIMEAEFSGTNAEIAYEFHTEGLVEGDIQKGEFFIICNKNEYSLPFVVSVTAPVDTIDAIILDSLEAFAQFARKDAKAAYHYFISNKFRNCIRKESGEVKLLARIFAYETAPYHNLEEFLFATGYKDEVKLTTSFQGGVYEGVMQDIREVIEITKHGWGDTLLEITAEEPFIVLQKNCYDGDDFVGNSCRIPFYIAEKELHGGKNYGRIFIKAGKYRFEFAIEATKAFAFGVKNEKRRDQKETALKMTKDYVEFRIGKMMPATWAATTLMSIDHLLAEDKENVMLWLAKAQVLAMSGRNQEATWILEQQKGCKENPTTKEYAYYLYVTTFLNPEKQFVRKVGTNVSQIYPYEEKEDVLFWILLLIDEAYENSKVRKYSAIRNYCLKHSYSPIFYAECWQLVKEQPALLEDLGIFEIRLLRWIFYKNLITADFSMDLAKLLLHNRKFQPKIVPILEYCYEEYQQDEVLCTLCSYLIRGNQFGEREYPFFKDALEKQMNITGLYEAYIISATEAKQTIFPKMVQYYLQYKSNLPYRYKAIVYRGIIQNRDKQTTLYLNCKLEIEQFALEQIRAGHMDENLAYIYEFFLKQISITPELSRMLAPLLYIHKLVCDDENMKAVVVVHRQTNRVMSYPIVQKEAYFPLYSKDYLIGFEDNFGQRYFKGMEYDLLVLLPAEPFSKKCLMAAPEQMPYLIHYFDGKLKVTEELSDLSEDEINGLRTLLSSEAICDEYKKNLRPSMIRYYYQTRSEEWQDDYLKWLDVSGLEQSVRIKACELLIERGFYEKAFQTIIEHGCFSVAPSLMLTLCSRMIEARNYEADDYLIGMCSMVFGRGKYDGVLLDYLARYMYGATKKLYEVWISCQDFQVPTFELEERILVQMLYTENFVNRSNDILTSYITNGGKKIVLDAYVSYFAYQYFVRDSIANELVMDQLYGEFKKDYSMTTLRKLALLKWLCESKSTDVSNMRSLYDDLILLGYRFQFFETLKKEVVFHFPRLGRRIIEFRGKKNGTYYIRYFHSDYAREHSEDGEFITEQMEEMYEGIFTKEVTLFYGDTVQYYICEEKNGVLQSIFSGQLIDTDVMRYRGDSRYEQLNAAIVAEQLGERKTVEDTLLRYDEWVKKAKKELTWIK